MNVFDRILEYMKEIKDSNRKENLYAKYPAKTRDQYTLNAYSQGYEDGTDNMYNALSRKIKEFRDYVEEPMDFKIETFHERMAECMKEKNISLDELAKKVCVSKEAMKSFLNGNRVPKGPIVVAIAKELGTTMSYLVTGDREKTDMKCVGCFGAADDQCRICEKGNKSGE